MFSIYMEAFSDHRTILVNIANASVFPSPVDLYFFIPAIFGPGDAKQ
jgi:hypothetical protein